MMDGSYPPGVSGWMIDQYIEGEEPCCGNCTYYDGEYCTKSWNNDDPDYCIQEEDDREADDYCDEWEGE